MFVTFFTFLHLTYTDNIEKLIRVDLSQYANSRGSNHEGEINADL